MVLSRLQRSIALLAFEWIDNHGKQAKTGFYQNFEYRLFAERTARDWLKELKTAESLIINTIRESADF